MLDGLGHARGNGEGDRRLSDPCGSDNRNESCSFAHRQDRVAGLSSSEDARCGDWKIVCTEAGRSVIVCSRIVTEDLDGGDEPVAPAADCLYIPDAASPVSQGPSEGRDVDLQVAFLDEGLRPDAGPQLLLAHQFARAFDERQQYFECAASDSNRLAALHERPPLGNEDEGTEQDCSIAAAHIQLPLVL